MKNATIVLFLITISFSCNKKHKNLQESVNIRFNDSLTSKLKTINKDEEIVGFSVAVIDQNSILYNESFGYADIKAKKRYQTNTIQNIGSISKTFIGISLLKAQELGKLNLNDPINEYLPFEVTNPYHPQIPITILHLATHTSSISDFEENYLKGFILKDTEVAKDEVAYSHFQNPNKRIPFKDFIEACFSKDGKWYSDKAFSKNIPGSTFEYTNFGADLCALVISEATGLSFKDFTKKHILEPLEMKDSAWSLKEVDSSRRSNFYLYKDQKIADYEPITYPDGGLFTTSEDLSKYLIELMNAYNNKGTLLAKHSYYEFFKERFEDKINDRGRINHGIFIEYNDDFIGSTDLLIGHNGSDFGSLAMMYFNPKTKIGKLLMVNTDIDYKDEIIVPIIKEIWKSIIDYERSIHQSN